MSPLEEIHKHPGVPHGIRLFVKRDDLLHADIPGNKWRKMAPLLQRFPDTGFKGILSFGGPFSNHLHALSAAGKLYGIPTAAIVRGNSASAETSPTLAFAVSQGMKWHPVSKIAFDRGPTDPEIQKIIAQYPGYTLMPEGGSSPEGVAQCKDIALEILSQTPKVASDKRFVAIGAGTGGTAAGLISGLAGNGKTLVFPATSHGFDDEKIKRHFSPEIMSGHFTLMSGYDFGGFAKPNPELLDFIRYFNKENNILLDPIYTGKMMYGLYDSLYFGFFPKKSVIVAVHTGGLQAWEGFHSRFGIEIP